MRAVHVDVLATSYRARPCDACVTWPFEALERCEECGETHADRLRSMPTSSELEAHDWMRLYGIATAAYAFYMLIVYAIVLRDHAPAWTPATTATALLRALVFHDHVPRILPYIFAAAFGAFLLGHLRAKELK